MEKFRFLRLSPEQRLKALGVVQHAYEGLPPLPVATTVEMAAAVRDGFAEGADVGYETDRFMNRAVWVAAELAKLAAMHRAATPTARAIAGFADKFSDCAAQTASRAIQEMTGVEVSAGYLVRTFGLPRTSISGYDAAVAYALNWFEAVGVKLAPRAGGFAPIAAGGQAGRYVMFFKGGASGGHVVFGEVTPTAIRVIDNQLGSVWSTLKEAESALGMLCTKVHRIESVALP